MGVRPAVLTLTRPQPQPRPPSATSFNKPVGVRLGKPLADLLLPRGHVVEVLHLQDRGPDVADVESNGGKPGSETVAGSVGCP